MCRNAVNGDRFLEISKLQNSNLKGGKGSENSSMTVSKMERGSMFGSSKLPPLMRAGKEMANESDEIAKALFGT
jgi:hypothetical protein